MDNIITTILSLIAAIFALAAPIATACINNKHIEKIKKIEIKYNQFLSAFKDFSESYYNLSIIENDTSKVEFERAAVRLTVLCQMKETQDSVLKLSKLILNQKNDASGSDISELYYHCIDLITQELSG